VNSSCTVPGAVRLFLVLLAMSAAACARSSQASEEAQAVDTVQLFGQACAKCHGTEGAGGLPTVANGPRPVDFRDASWQRSRSDDDIAAAIRNGRGAMPPFADLLTPGEIVRLTRHVRSLHTR
jgi:mono/diheme cytochrome c family protein